jgi:RhoGEF domain/Pleckstrin homology domain
MPPQPAELPVSRHPTHRPLPSAPSEDDTESDFDEEGDGGIDEMLAQEQIYQEIEAAVGSSSSQSRNSRGHGSNRQNGDLLDSELRDPHRYDSQATTINQPGVDRFPSTASTISRNNQETIYPSDDESDAEAVAGLEAMRIAEEQDAMRASGGFGLYGSTPKRAQLPGDSSDSDYANIDMGLYGGGYDAHMSYGDDLATYNAGNLSEMEDQSRPLPTPDELHRSEGHVPAPGLGGMIDYSLPGESSLHPFPSFDASSRVDTSVAAAAQLHRLSFDEGDEQGSLSSRFTESRLSGRSGSESPTKDDIQEMFYHPGMSSSTQRPLPAVPSMYDNRAPQLLPAGTYRHSQHQQHSYSNIDTSRRYYAPDGPDAYTPSDMLSPSGQFVPRSASLASHSNTPQVVPPVRSRTDAEERQARQRQLRQHGLSGASLDGFDMSTPQSSIPLDLPALPLGRRRKISPANLRSADFKKCQEPWALSNLAEWLKEMCGGENGEGESDLREKTIAECLVALFTHKVSTMNTADAETLSDRVVKSMFEVGALLPEEEWVKFGQGTVSGVLWQLTGSGCYAPKLHEHEIHGRCYSHHCHRTLRKINLNAQSLEPSKKSEDWNTFFKVTKEQTEAADKKEVQRQYNLHEIVMSEDKYMDRLNVLRILYRDELQSWQPPIIGPSKLPRFIAQVFGKVEAIKRANEEYLLRELKFRQQEQGPWIIGFSDIFREWIRKARQVYLDYAAGYPQATHLVRKEAEKNLLFRQFLDQARDNRLSDRLDWNTYLFAPLKRLQQYTLLLREVHRHSYVENDEKTNLALAIEEINNVTLECDAKVDEMSKKVEMIELSQKLYLRPGMEGVELNLDHLGRRLIFKGDLQRAGTNRFNWLETHAILFDHYFVLAKTVPQRDASGGRSKERYDVSKLVSLSKLGCGQVNFLKPIPMELLVLESANDDPVVKSSVKGLGTVTTITRPAPSTDQRLSRMNTNGERPNTLEHVNSSSSISTTTLNRTTTVTNTEGDAKSMYPFRIKHLGKSDVYTLYAPTAANRQDWCDKIIEAKERHATSLFAQNAEPFRLRIMADTSFAYDAASAAGKGGGIPIKGTPLDRAIREMEHEYGPIRPAPVCRAMVNCATTFKCYGKNMVAIGTDYGVYISEASNPRGWARVS